MQSIDNGVNEEPDQLPEFLVGREAALLDLVELGEEPIERILMTRKENLLLVVEVVVEISLLHVQHGRYLLDRRTVVPETTESRRRALENLDARRDARHDFSRSPGASPLPPSWLPRGC